MAKGNRRDLYLQVSGDIGGLRSVMTAGKTVINDFGSAAINVLEEVEKEMAKIGTSGLPGLKETERAYQDTFRRISDSARDVATAPSGAAAAQILDANATRDAAAAATAKAQSLRILAEAANRADLATGGTSAATRAYAVAAATAALNAEREADALREQAQVLGLVERELGTSLTTQRRGVAVSGEARAGYQQLSYQLGDVATQYASGTAASIIFAQQSGQVVQAIGMISGKTTGFIGFLGGPWGIALSSALVVLSPWVGKLLEGNDALGDGIEKLKKDAQETENSRQAHAAYSNTLEGQIDAQRRLNEELERGLKSQRQLNREKLQTSLDNEAKALIEVTKAETALTKARETAAKAKAAVLSPNLAGGPESAMAALAVAQAAEARVKAAETRLTQAQEQRDRAARGARAANVKIAADEARDAADPLAAINAKYDDMAEKAKSAALANDKLAASIRGTLDGIEKERAVSLKVERDKQSAASRNAPSLGTQVTTERSASLLSSAQQYRGLSETRDNGALQSLFKQAGANVDPKMTAWCAAFVNAVLATNGLPGTGSLSARSFAKYGTETNRPVAGDIVVSKRGTGEQGHVGFFQGVDAKRNVKVFGGNTGDRVGTQTVKRGDVLAFRRAPTAGAAATSIENAENTDTQNADAYASLLSGIKERELRVAQSRLVSISELAENDRQQIELARQDIERAADKGAALGKWTQAEADAAKLRVAQVAAIEKEGIDDRERVALRQQAIDVEVAQLSSQSDFLELQSQLAGTSRDRHRIALQLLEIESQQARKAIERQLAGEKDPVQRAQLADDLSNQARDTAMRRQILERQNASPIAAYKQELADFDIEDELESAEVRFFENLNEELADSATQFLKLKGVAGDFFNQLIADVIRLQIKQAASGSGGLIGGLLKLVGAASGGGNAIAGSLETANANAAGLAAAIDTRNLRGFSGGGWTGSGRRTDVAGVVHGQEYVMDAATTARIGVSTLDAMRAGKLTSRVPTVPSVASAERALSSAPGHVRIEVAEGAMFEPRVTAISGNVSAQVAASTAPVLVGAASGQAQASMAQRARRQIR